jgi:two-component system chemotaxis response regulator CheY
MPPLHDGGWVTIQSKTDNITILIVDDSPVALLLLRDILEECGYVVVGEAADGVEAVEKHRELQPMVTIMDVSMPRMDGVEASREILARDPGARILISSASDHESLIAAAADAGAWGCIAKPLLLEKVAVAINAVIVPSKHLE